MFLISKTIHCIKLQSKNWLNSYQRLFMEGPGNAKKSKMYIKKIGTHDGNFHCDEILAIYMLQQLDEYKNANIIRTRDLNLLKDCDIVVDVGREFNLNEKKFDHHQGDFIETFSSLRPELGTDYNIRLSSAGLIYVYFGENVISNVLKKNNIILSDNSLKLIYKKIYESFIREIDAIDNGIPICDGKQQYDISTDLSSRVKNLFPPWNCTEKVDIMDRFEKGKIMAGNEFEGKILQYATVWIPARDIVKKAMENATKIHESGQIILLSKICPWKAHLFDIENELDLKEKFRYVVYEDHETDWRVMCVPLNASSFICRKFLPEDWRGKTGEKISKLSGIKDAQFCHANGFIGGALSKDGAIQMAIQSLNRNYVV